MMPMLNIFKKTTPQEFFDKNMDIYIKELHDSWEKILEEVQPANLWYGMSPVDTLSDGIKLGYDNFGDFVEAAYGIVDMLINKKIKPISEYADILAILKSYTDKINYVRGVSSLSAAQFHFVKRNIGKMIDAV